MDVFLFQFLNFDIMRQAWPIIFNGAKMTLLLCLAVIPLGLAGGLVVATGSISHSRAVRFVTKGYVDFFRAVPPLVLLIVIYSGLPFAGIRMSPFTAVCIAFLLNASSFYGEIFRAGIESVGKGQWEAARSTGLTWAQTYRFVVLPQASRNVLPDLVSNTVEVIKLTSIASVVSFTELLYAADMARSVTYNTSPIVLAAFLYLIVLWPIVRLVSRLEHRLGH
ncbi:MAG: Amino acid ABC transporter permease [Xanthobacteraceae bacterium]|nr:MAG: Amino acid ABC transporter permease [Xanthobacteraceae bacterium]